MRIHSYEHNNLFPRTEKKKKKQMISIIISFNIMYESGGKMTTKQSPQMNLKVIQRLIQLLLLLLLFWCWGIKKCWKIIFTTNFLISQKQ